MALEQTTARHIAETLELMRHAREEAAEVERYLARTMRAVERSKKLLKRTRDPLNLAILMGDVSERKARPRNRAR